MSLTNNFVFGERRVLVTGQAAGFLNMMAEGMSCAMHSGAIAGESIVESFTRNRDANAIYDDLIQSERKRTVDQWNPLKILFDNPHEADLKAAIMKFPLSDRAYMVKEMLAYIGQFRGYSWVTPILIGRGEAAVPRPVLNCSRRQCRETTKITKTSGAACAAFLFDVLRGSRATRVCLSTQLARSPVISRTRR